MSSSQKFRRKVRLLRYLRRPMKLDAKAKFQLEWLYTRTLRRIPNRIRREVKVHRAKRDH